jgi:hypothetical protein
MSLIRNPRKLVRPGQWVLAKIPESSWIKRHSYDFRSVDVSYICVLARQAPDYRFQNAFEWFYDVAWRIPDRHIYKDPDYDGLRYSHDKQYLMRIDEEDRSNLSCWKDREYYHASPSDFGLLEYSGSWQPVYDEDEHKRRRSGVGGYLYEPASEDPKKCPGEDYSLYFCDKCNKFVVPWSNDEGELVCADCDSLDGLVYREKAAANVERARELADFVDGRIRAAGHNPGKSRESLERSLNCPSWSRGDGAPSRTLLFAEDEFSFGFLRQHFVDGKWKTSYNGGIIMHGPHVKILPDGGYEFTTWDYYLKRNREATPEEIGNINWSTHT